MKKLLILISASNTLLSGMLNGQTPVEGATLNIRPDALSSGDQNILTGSVAAAIGTKNSSNEESIAIGNYNRASSRSGTIGVSNHVRNNSFAIGFGNRVNYYTVNTYNGNETSDENGSYSSSLAVGSQNYVLGANSLAVGSDNEQKAQSSLLVGSNLYNTQNHSLVIGQYNKNMSGLALSVGNGSIDSERNALEVFTDGSLHAGVDNTSTEESIHILGDFNNVSGSQAKTIGSDNYINNADHAIAIGKNLSVDSKETVAIGKYNEPIVASSEEEEAILVVGTGTGVANDSDMRNSLLIRKNGDIEMGEGVLKIQEGKVLLEAPQGGISMGIFTPTQD